MTKILYVIQTFKAPEHIYRLAQIIKAASPTSSIIISHDYTVSHLDVEPLQSLGAQVLKVNGKGGRGDFSMVQSYLEAIEWASTNKPDFDWCINLSGQDYPTQPLPQLEQFLAKTPYDGFLDYFEAFSAPVPWGLKESENRYLYQYWRSGRFLSRWERGLLRPFVTTLNQIQPFVRINWAYDGLMVGLKAKSTLFDENFICYGGSFFCTLSRKCVDYLYTFSNENPDVVQYYKKSCVSVESFLQTVLVNSHLFNLCNNSNRYIDFANSEDSSRPRILTYEDYSHLAKDDIHFARKFEQATDSKILDLLDARILHHQEAPTKRENV